MTDERKTDDLAEQKRKAVEEAKRKAAELKKAREEKKAEETKASNETKESGQEAEGDLAKKKAAAAAKAKAAALKKKKELGQGGADEKAKAAAAARAKAEALKKKKETEASGEDDKELAKKKAVAAAKAKAAALKKKKEQEQSGTSDDEKAKAVAAAKAKAAALKKKSGATDDEKAKAIAAAKAKAKAAAAAKAKSAKAKEDEPDEEIKPSPNQPILDRYLSVIRENLGDDLLEDAYINRLSKDVPTLVAKPDSYFKLAQFLKYNEQLGFDYLSETHGTDFETHMEIYNHFYSYKNNQSVALKVMIDREKPVVSSITPLWEGANWPEREAFDLLGIVFEGHPNLTRIMMPDDWVGHPLRKDYEPYDVEV